MEKELKAFTDGTYVFQETETEGQFLFYRQDEGILENIDREPMDMYQNYICQQMISGELDCAVFSNVYTKMSEDNKVILISTEMEKMEIETRVKITPIVKRENSVKRMIKSLFKPKK